MGFINVGYHGIHVEGPEQFTAVILAAPEKNRVLPIWMETKEAENIRARDSGHHPKRPTAHDILADTLIRLTSGCRTIRITSHFEGVFIATLITNGGEELDARPSDALLLSRILELPIEVDEDVFAHTSVFINDADLSRLFNIHSAGQEEGVSVHDSASGDAQADADFEELMQSMGVFETDLLSDEDNPDDGSDAKG